MQLCYLQDIGKSETQFNLRLNNYHKDVHINDLPQADQHQLPHCKFNQHTKFTLIEQLHNLDIDKELATLRLKKQEDFWIMKLKSLHPNAELNLPNTKAKNI